MQRIRTLAPSDRRWSPGLTSLVLAAALVVPSLATASRYTTVSLFWGGNDEDSLTATSLAGLDATGFVPVRVEGQLLADAEPGTVALKQYHDPQRGDHALVATRQAIAEVEAKGYRLVRTEGHLHETRRENTVPVWLYRDGDDYLTVLSETGVAVARSTGYEPVGVQGHAPVSAFVPKPAEGRAPTEPALSIDDDDFVPLDFYWNAARHDGMTVATAEGRSHAGQHGYVRVATVGRVLARELRGTAPLMLYWHPGRQDHLLATEDFQTAESGAYELVRVEGYLLPREGAGTLPLGLYWNGAGADYATTTEAAVPAEGDYFRVQVLGHVMAPR